MQFNINNFINLQIKMKTVIILFLLFVSVFAKHSPTPIKSVTPSTATKTSSAGSSTPLLSTTTSSAQVSTSMIASSSQAASSSAAASSSQAASSSAAASSSPAASPSAATSSAATSSAATSSAATSSAATSSVATSSAATSSAATSSPAASSSPAPSSSPAASSSASSPVPASSAIASSSAHVSSMSISSGIAPSASSSMAPASSKVPTTPPPTTPMTTKKPIHYDVDVTLEDEKTGVKCVWFNANMNLTYQLHGQNKSTTVHFNSKTITGLTGECNNLTVKGETSEIVMAFKDMGTFTVVFKTKADKSWIFKEVGISMPAKNQNADVFASKTFGDDDNTQFLRAESGHAYSCLQQEFVPLDSKNGTFTLAFTEILVQPFQNGGNRTTDVDQCSSKSESSSSSSIVPIAVGCALAGLIVIVLIAYLIGRRKNDGRGYQQV